MAETIEQEARRLRDLVYGTNPEPTAESWHNMAEHWIADIDWLRRQAAKERKV